MAIDTGTRVPAGILPFIFNFHRYYILAAILQFISYIIPKAGVAIRMCANILSVNKYGGVHIHPVKLNNCTLAFLGCGYGKCFTIPGCPSYRKPTAYLADGILSKR